MEETSKAKQVAMNNPANKKASEKKTAASYEELNNYCVQLFNQNKQLREQIQQLNMVNLFKRLDYLFLVLQNKDNFDSDFIGDCVAEIKSVIAVPESEDTTKEGE